MISLGLSVSFTLPIEHGAPGSHTWLKSFIRQLFAKCSGGEDFLRLILASL